MKYLPDIADANVIFLGELPQVGVVLSAVQAVSSTDVSHILVSQLPSTPTPSGGDIPHVLSLGTGVEMIWVDTCPDITCVQDVQPGGDWPVVEFPRDTVGKQAGATVPAELSIPLLNNRACPYPASIGNIDVLPKSISDCSVATSVVTSPRTIQGGVETDGGRVDVEDGGALLAGSGNGNLGAHRKLLSSGAMPPAVSSSAGAFMCPNYTLLFACISGN